MAQDIFEQLHAAVKQAESQGKRYDEKGNLLTSLKGAQGEMQVMPKTSRDPGYGVVPAQGNHPDEIARVGKDYLKAMVDKYGDTQKAVIAYNWGPRNTDNWLAAGADPKVLPAETKGYVARISKSLGSEKMAPLVDSGPTESEKVMTKALGSGMSAQNLVQDAGPGYKAAMAMMFLADDKPETSEDDIWKEAEAPVEPEQEAPSALASLDLGYQSPFPAQRPQQVAHLASGGVPFIPKAVMSGTARDELQAMKDQWDAYTPQATAYNDALSKWKTDTYEPYTAAVDKYNADAATYNAGPRTSTFTAVAPTAIEDFSMGAPKAPEVTQEQYQAKADTANAALRGRQMGIDAVTDPERFNLSLNKFFAGGGDVSNETLPAIEDTTPDPFYSFKSANKQYVGNRELENMMMGLGTDSTTLGVNLSKMRQDDKENLAQNLMAAYRKQVGDVNFNANVMRPVDAQPGVYMGGVSAGIPVGNRDQVMLGINGMRTPDETKITGYNLGYSGEMGPGRLNAMVMQPKGSPHDRGYQIQYQMPFKAEGGIVHRADGSPMGGENVDHLTPQEIERMSAAQAPAFVTPSSGRNRVAGPISQALASGEAYPAMARGVAETPYDVVGGFVDLTTLAMRPFGYKDEKPVMGSDWLKEKMTKYGIRPGEEANPTLQGFRTAGELGASVVNPGPVAAKVGQAAEKGAAAVGKEAARQVMRGMEGEGPLKSVSPPIMYAVKPRGGTFASSGSIANEPLSDFDKLLNNYLDRSLKDAPDTSHEAIREFIDKKARKYFTTEYGTGDDSLRTAMRTGEMPLSGSDVDRFPPYLLHAAANPEVPGHGVAKRDLEKLYDKATNMDAKVLGLHNSADGDARTRFREFMDAQKEKDRQLMSAEGVPDEFQNSELRGYAISEFEGYPTSTRTLQNLIKAGEEGKLPEGVKGALQRQQPIYDINEPYLSMLSPKIVAENISVVPPNKLKNMSFADAMVEGSKKMNVYRNYDAAVAKAERGGTVPKEVSEMFTKPFLKGETGEWRQITDSRATALEGKLMNHSVGSYKDGDRYGVEYTGLPYGGKKAFDEGLVKVYSLRDDKGLPTVTIEMAKSDAGKGDKWNITQIRSRFNSEPAANQWDDIFKFIDKGEKHIGQIKQNSYSLDNTGKATPGSVVNWGSAYRDWKDGIDPMLGVQRSDNPPGWGQAGMAQGGAVERVLGDNRRYL